MSHSSLLLLFLLLNRWLEGAFIPPPRQFCMTSNSSTRLDTAGHGGLSAHESAVDTTLMGAIKPAPLPIFGNHGHWRRVRKIRTSLGLLLTTVGFLNMFACIAIGVHAYRLFTGLRIGVYMMLGMVVIVINDFANTTNTRVSSLPPLNPNSQKALTKPFF